VNSSAACPNASSSKIAWVLKMHPCPATGSQFV
jgi:hypothetical protein